MFVFPAFDSNYKTRKRTFRCCQNCRVKRVKCDISSTNYEVAGCLNCQKHGWDCNLKKPLQSGDVTTASPVEPVKPAVEVPALSVDEKITSAYLKLNYNFNCCNNNQEILSYLYHGHPRAVIALQDSRYHESGVYVKVKPHESRTTLKSKHEDEVGCIKSRKVFDFLCCIDAFTLASKEYPITPQQTTQLLRIYFYKLNSIFPIVLEDKFWEDYYGNNAQNSMLYAMVLVVLRDKLAEPIFREIFLLHFGELSDSQFAEQLRSFMIDLEYKLRQILLILPQLGDEDKFTRFIVSLLLCLHYSFDRLGNETSSHDLTDAINLAVSLGIHMKSFGEINPKMAEYTTHLWWCCYIFDRLNGLVNSRCLFIRADDFNVDLPYNCINLLKLVQLARTIENMVSAIYKPFNTNTIIVTKNRYKMFNSEDFQRMEFDLCDKERETNPYSYDIIAHPDANNVVDYVMNTIHFLSRIINNSVIMVAQKAKYDDSTIPNSVPEQTATKAALNILWYHAKMKDEAIINIPSVPWCVSIAMALALKLRTRKYLAGEVHDGKVLVDFTWEDSINSLERFASTWWIIDDISRLSREFSSKIINNTQYGIKRVRKKSKLPATNVKRVKEGLKAVEINKILQHAPPQANEQYSLESSNIVSDFSTIPINMDISDIQYDKYFESMQIDVFNNDFFKDVSIN